jgi:hypothetical protein
MFYNVFYDVQIYFVMFGGIFSSFYLTLIKYFTNIIIFLYFHDICDVLVVYI